MCTTYQATFSVHTPSHFNQSEQRGKIPKVFVEVRFTFFFFLFPFLLFSRFFAQTPLLQCLVRAVACAAWCGAMCPLQP
jgi:hypothetical protein